MSTLTSVREREVSGASGSSALVGDGGGEDPAVQSEAQFPTDGLSNSGENFLVSW